MRWIVAGLKTCSLLALAAVVARVFAGRAEAAPLVSLVVVGGCVAVLAYRRSAETGSIGLKGRSSTGHARTARSVAAATIFAATVIGLLDLAFVLAFEVATIQADRASWSTFEDGRYDRDFVMRNAVIGTAVALSVATCLRRGFDRTRSPCAGQWLCLGVLILVAEFLVLLFGVASQAREVR